MDSIPSPKTRVVHVADNIPDAVYIGRSYPRKGLARSIFCNPFTVKKYGRTDAIRMFRMQFGYELNTDPRVGPALIPLRGKPLACFCRHDGEEPTTENECHGDVLIWWLERFSDDQLREMVAADAGGARHV